MNKRVTVTLVVSLLVAVVLMPGLRPAEADTPAGLSPYWGPTIAQWAELTVYYAGQRGLDPDLISSIIFEESHGLPNQISVVGAVGLMQIMPAETGFSWRPGRAELLKPSVNIYWGTGTFSQIVQQAHGSLNRALAAYNGGWAQEDLHGPKLFASKVLNHYARAIVARAGYESHTLKAWTLVLDIRTSAGLLQTDVIKSDGTFQVNGEFDLDKLPASTPHATAYANIDEDNVAWFVEAWVIVEPIEGHTLVRGRGTY